MKLITNNRSQTVIETVGLDQTWTSKARGITVNSTNVMDFYPSRLNLEYSSDEQDKFYLVKNKTWSSYENETRLDEMFNKVTPINRRDLLNGLVPIVREFNYFVLSATTEFAEIKNPDELTLDNYDECLAYVIRLIDDRLLQLKYNKVNNKGSVVNKINYQLELLGSIYQLYRAKYKLL